jgi:branched-chain amino acid transport system substrate-binding protein
MRIAAAAIAALASIMLAACGSSSSNSAGASGNPKEILIGFPACLTGLGAAYCVPEANAAQMVANAINASGGIKDLGGAKLKLVINDTQTNPTVAAQVIREMAREGVSAFIGPVTSPEMVDNKPLLESLKIPDFTEAGDASLTQDNVNGYIFRISSQTAGAATDALAYVAHLVSSGAIKDLTRVGVVDTSTPPGSSVTPVLTAGLKQMGISTTLITYDPANTNDFAPIVSKLQAANVQMVMGFQDPPDGLEFAQAVAHSGWRPTYGVFGVGAPEFLDSFRKTAGSAATGWLDTAFDSNLDSDIYTAQTQQLAAEFLKKYGMTIEGSSANLGASAMTVIADAIAAARSADPAKIAAAARTLRFSDPKGSEYPYYMTPGGVKFDSNQDDAALVIPIIQVTPNDGFATVYPSSVATAQLAPLS